MFHQLFDLLPNYIDDWIDSRHVAAAVAAPLFSLVGQSLPEEWGGMLPQEYMINLNAMMCMLLAFLVGFLTGKVRSMTAMIAGILVASAAIYSLGLSTNGWWIMLAIASFSLGELMSSPTKMRYFSSIAPPGKQGLYLGYINATGGIGWALGSLIAGSMYEADGDKVVLARRYLVEELAQDQAAVDALAKTEVVPRLADLTNGSTHTVRELLFHHYDPSYIWTHFALIGIASMVGLLIFDGVTRAKTRYESVILLALTVLLSGWTYGATPAMIFGFCIITYMILENAAPQLLPTAGGVDDT